MKKELVKSIAANVMVLLLSVLLLLTMSFAWIVSSVEQKTPQTMQVGNFKVDIAEHGFNHIESPVLIALDAAYPQTQASAVEENALGKRPVYTFAVTNTGDIAAQIRLSVQVRSDSGYAAAAVGALPLSSQIRYLIKVYSQGTPEPTEWLGGGSGNADDVTQGGLLFGAQNGNLSFKQFMNSTLLQKNSDNNYTGTGKGLLDVNSTVVFKMLVWLDENATLISTGANTTGKAGAHHPKLAFSVMLDALQSGGGAAFLQGEVADNPDEAIPKTVAKEVKG